MNRLICKLLGHKYIFYHPSDHYKYISKDGEIKNAHSRFHCKRCEFGVSKEELMDIYFQERKKK